MLGLMLNTACPRVEVVDPRELPGDLFAFLRTEGGRLTSAGGVFDATAVHPLVEVEGDEKLWILSLARADLRQRAPRWTEDAGLPTLLLDAPPASPRERDQDGVAVEDLDVGEAAGLYAAWAGRAATVSERSSIVGSLTVTLPVASDCGGAPRRAVPFTARDSLFEGPVPSELGDVLALRGAGERVIALSRTALFVARAGVTFEVPAEVDPSSPGDFLPVDAFAPGVALSAVALGPARPDGTREVLAAGASGPRRERGVVLTFRLDPRGLAFVATATETAGTLTDVIFDEDGRAVAVGAQVLVREASGDPFVPRSPPNAGVTLFRAALGLRDDAHTDVVAGEDGSFYFGDAARGAWQRTILPSALSSSSPQALATPGGAELWVVGDRGRFLRRTDEWTFIDPNYPEALEACGAFVGESGRRVLLTKLFDVGLDDLSAYVVAEGCPELIRVTRRDLCVSTLPVGAPMRAIDVYDGHIVVGGPGGRLVEIAGD